MNWQNNETLNECMIFPFAKATLTNFLEKEDNNLRFFYELRPEPINNHKIQLHQFEIPRGFSQITHQKFYFNPQKFIRKQELETIDKTQLWMNAIENIMSDIKLKKFKDEDSQTIQQYLANQLEKDHVTNYMYKSYDLIKTRENYFADILIYANKLCPQESAPHIEARDMTFRDKIFKEMFPKKEQYENFFNEYITKKYKFPQLELIATTTLFNIYDNFMENGEIKEQLKQEYNKQQNKLSLNKLNELEQLEKKLIKNRANIRIYNSKFEEKFAQSIYITKH
ncbi:MAG: hypothetical protein ACOC1K_01980 [Nanoarchaeota archaeon]